MAKKTSVIPAGYTFLNLDTMMTVKGKELTDDLRKRTDARDPDRFGVHIRVYSDYLGYGMMSLIESYLRTLHTKITTKSYDDAYALLEALTVFMDYENEWAEIDDGELVTIANNAYGALAVALLRRLKKTGRLSQEAFPSLEYLLKGIVSVGETLDSYGCESEYAPVARGIARRLFKDKSRRDFNLEKKRRQEWLRNIKDKELQKYLEPEMKQISKEMQEEQWYMKGEVANEDVRNPSLSLAPVYKEFKEYTRGSPEDYMWETVYLGPEDKRECSLTSSEDF